MRHLSDDERELCRLWEADAAIGVGSPSAGLEHFAPDVCALWVDGRTLAGVDEIRREAEALGGASGTRRLEYSDLGCRITGDTGYIQGRFVLCEEIAEIGPVEMAGRFTATFHRGEGGWECVLAHYDGPITAPHAHEIGDRP